MSLSILELIKEAKSAGLSPEEIKVLVDKENEREVRQRENEREVRQRENEREVRQRENEREERENEREERQRDRDLKKLELEATEAAKQRAHELALAKLKQECSEATRSNESFPGLKLPNFHDGKDDIDDFLKRFECVAEIQKWESSNLHVYLGSVLSGKALKIYVSLPIEVQRDYVQLKEVLLKGYSVDGDSYRKKFRESKVGENETHVQLMSRMRQYLDNWLTLSDVPNDFNSLCEFLVKDQFLSNCPIDLRVFLKERNFENNVEMAQAADRFRSAHKSVRSHKPYQTKEDQVDKVNDPRSNVVCHNCKKSGHIRPNCPELSASVKNLKSYKVNFVFESDLAPQACLTDIGVVFNRSAKVFLDTGCSTIIVKSSLVPPNVKRGKLVKLYDYLGIGRYFPEIRCYIKSKFLTGWVTAVAAPIRFTDVLIGLVPGVKKSTEILNVEKGCVDIESELRDSASEVINNDNANEVVNNEIVDNVIAMGVMTRAKAKISEAKLTPLKVPDISHVNVSKSDLISAQSECQSLEHIRKKVLSQDRVNVKNRTVKYEKVNGLIYRICMKSRNEHEVGMKQLVVPSKFRQYILSTAHDSTVSGHFSHRKTAEKIFRKFFWPGAGADVKRYCRSCHVCQKSCSKGKVSKVPMVSMPIISEPFSRVAIDLVGPLNASSRGHKYILTMIDCATRFPEAVPLKNIDTVTVAESLVEIFSRVGIPKEILTDRGTQFKSDLMGEINRLLSIKALFTSPYHACCNGTVERFHAVLKSMLKKLCQDKPQDWDRYLPSVLFAYREIPNDTLKFSPFELLYGRRVRGPLTILHDIWTKDELNEDLKITYQYVLDLRTRLEDSAKLASANAAVNSKLYKTYFDKNTKSRSLAVGDDVLVLLPSSYDKLKMQWKGPYPVVKRHDNGVDYLIKTRGKVKLFHINMLKKYIRREDNKESEIKKCQVCIVDDAMDNLCNDTCDISLLDRAKSDEVNVNLSLPNTQVNELKDLISNFPDVFSNDPGLTNTITHKINLTTDVPVHRKPYPVPHHLQKPLDDEVDRMLNLGVIEPSTSPYGSPVVLLKKADNTWRFYVDFRELNSQSI